MTYLAWPRVHFAGTFQASPSTVNNVPERYEGATLGHVTGGWNPRGDGTWRLLDCRVTSALRADGAAAAGEDPALGCRVCDSERAVAGKLVDLDPQQQLVSEIWGAEVRLCDGDGATLLRGRFEPAPFSDIWDRAQAGGGGA